ncbi:MMPL family transporter [Micromonospora sp. CPCC 206061]|uniref:MMPL family transporter n=1 Tax=Micromonospora sp. CPCC 206061 TaxID=3122410 RepID=UPI002FF1D848
MATTVDQPESTPVAPQGARSRPLLVRVVTFAVRRKWTVLFVSLVFTVLAGVSGADLSDRLRNGGYIPQDAESERAARFMAAEFHAGNPDLVVIASATRSVDDPDSAAAGVALVEALNRRADVASVESYWPSASPLLRSHDGKSALLLVRLAGSEDARQDAVPAVLTDLERHRGPFTLAATGESPVNREIIEQSERDLVRAELLAAPLTIVILLIGFGSVVAAGTPAAIGVVAVTGALAVLEPLAGVTDVSVFALNVATVLGFGLAVDYSLFVVTRYREEVAYGRQHAEAVVVAVSTAGRTVLFSAAAVALSLTALMVYPLFFLRSIAYSAILVVTFGAVASVVVLPALLAAFGPRLLTRGPRRRIRPARSERWWGWLAERVMNRPVLIGGSVALVLVLLALPFAGVRFGLADARVLPASAPAARGEATLKAEFDAAAVDAVTVVLPGIGASRVADVRTYASRLSAVADVAYVDSAAGRFVAGGQEAPPDQSLALMSSRANSYLRLVLDQPVYSDRALAAVRALRAAPAPAPPLVGGATATLVDARDVVGGRLPWVLAILGVSTLVVLFLFTGSVLVPVKALLLTVLSLTATFGVMVYVFQDGHLAWLVGDFTATGYLELTIPILVFCVAFGLSMDYEVFLLSRIREQFLRDDDNRRSVVVGMRQTGRVITMAALVVASVLVALATSRLSVLKLLGVALAMAVLVDAILVRGILVPAVMRLAGRANWWAPAPLRRLHARIGIGER